MDIVIKDYQSIKEAKIKANGLTYIVGSFDQGKSSIYRAVLGSIYNQSGEDFIRDGCKETTVAIKFDGQQPFKFIWVKSRDEGGSYILESGRHSKLKGKPLEEVINNGLSAIETSKDSIFLNFWGQMEPFFLVNKSDTVKFEILSQIFSGDKYANVLKEIAVDAKTLEREKTDLFVQKETLEGEIEELSKQSEKFENLLKHKKIVDKMNETVARLNKIKELGTKYFSRKKELKQKEEELEIAKERHEIISVSVDSISKLLEKERGAKRSVDVVRTIGEKRSQLGKIEADISITTKKLKLLVKFIESKEFDRLQEISKLRDRYTELTRRLGDMEKAESEAKESRDSLIVKLDEIEKEIGVCPLCQRPFEEKKSGKRDTRKI